MHCHLLIPGFSSPFFPTSPDLLQALHLPSLTAMLARGRQDSASGDWMEHLCREFGLKKQHDWPVAALTLLAEGGKPGNDFWLLAAPVHLQLRRNQMVLMEADDLGITNDEAAGLTATLNRHFADDGLIFSSTNPAYWHLRFASPIGIVTHPLEVVIGKNIREFLPGGPDENFWRRTFNEIQMLLHDHPANAAREQRGALPINSIWPWGGGMLPGKATSSYAKVWAEDRLAIGLAILSGTPHAQPAKTAAEWLQHAEPGQHLIILDSLSAAALHGDVHRWRESLLELENDWFAPLHHALSRGKLTRLSLTIFEDSQTRTFSVTRNDLRKFWRRKKLPLILSGAPST